MLTGFLGPLTVEYNGVSIVPSAGKPRQILTLLALRAGQSVPVGALLEEVWGQSAPRSAATTLQTYILQLRRLIMAGLPGPTATSPKDVLSTRYGGYGLVPRPERHDLSDFQDLARRGARALETGDARAASARMTEALALWRGPALADVPVGPVLQLEATAMEEARLQVLAQRIEADLRLGRHAAVVAELRMLTAHHPLNESLCAQLMTALHRSGSRWRALEEFRRLRGHLSDELGVEPAPHLQRLHQAILAADPAVDRVGGAVLGAV